MRWSSGTLPTDRRFTGQREETGLGLYDYAARRYDPLLGRFIQADTIVPSPQSPQSLNRYAYVLNSPLRYTDPTGHCVFGVDTVVCIAVGGAVLGAVVGYGAQVYQNAQKGMAFGDALTTDIDPGPIVQGVFLGGAVATGVSFVATALGIGAGAGTIASTAATAACADGDCTNEANALLQLRQSYEHEVLRLRDETQRRISEGDSLEEVARWAHQARRDLGVAYKNMTPPDILDQIYQRNIEKYGDPLGPSIDFLREQGKTWADIIESASRPGGRDIISLLLESRKE